MDKYTVGQARRLANITVRGMAKELGLSANAYHNKEKGRSRFYFDEAMKFSAVVNIPMDRIFFESSVSQN